MGWGLGGGGGGGGGGGVSFWGEGGPMVGPHSKKRKSMNENDKSGDGQYHRAAYLGGAERRHKA